jgi:two-component system chemotaxis response regulator CheB
MELDEGRVYVAKPDWHVLVERDHLHLSHGPKENHSRPALNPLFRSAAIAYGGDAIGVILSGNLDDGVAGLWEIKRRGGIVIAQQPEEALYPDMPSNAIRGTSVDYVRPAAEIGPLVGSLVGGMAEKSAVKDLPSSGMRTAVTCPECRGPMWKFSSGNTIEFQCRVKHTYSAQSMLEAHAKTEERHLWSAVVALEEGADLLEQLNPQTRSEGGTALIQEAGGKRALARQIRDAMEARANGAFPDKGPPRPMDPKS